AALLAGLPIAFFVEVLRACDADGLEAFTTWFEAGTRDLGSPLGRGVFSTMVLRAADEMHNGVDPEDTIRVFLDAIRLHGTPAASRVPISERLAALPRKEVK